MATDAGPAGALTAAIDGLLRVHWPYLASIYCTSAIFAKAVRPMFVTCLIHALVCAGAVMLSAFAEPLLPGWTWYPAVWFNGFRVVEPSELGPALALRVELGVLVLKFWAEGERGVREAEVA